MELLSLKLSHRGKIPLSFLLGVTVILLAVVRNSAEETTGWESSWLEVENGRGGGKDWCTRCARRMITVLYHVWMDKPSPCKSGN